MLTHINKNSISSYFNFQRFFAQAAPKKEEEPPKPTADDIIFQKADKIIEERIRPIIRDDGGDVSLEDVKNGILIVELSGACQGCRSKNNTLYNGILGIVRDEVPGVRGIREKMDFDDFHDD